MPVDVADVLARAAAILAELDDLRDVRCLDHDQLEQAVAGFRRVRGQLEAAEARTLDGWNLAGGWRISGAKSAAARVAGQQHLPIGVAQQRLRHGRFLRQYPAIGRAWHAGEIDRAHVITLTGACTPRTRAAFSGDHEILLEAARTNGFIDFKQVCDIWSLMADPDGAEDKAKAEHEAREVHLSQSFGGMWFGRMTYDRIDGEVVNTTLRLIERELFEADWAKAKAELGRKPLISELWRTPSQRRADALVEMAIRARTAPKGGRRPAPLFTVVVGYETFAGPVLEMFNRRVVTPGRAADWLTEADIERVVFDGPSRVVDVGRTRRFYRGAIRRALEVRDRTCFHQDCDEPPSGPRPTTSRKQARAASPPRRTANWPAPSTTAGATSRA
jgi:hypothetical protein